MPEAIVSGRPVDTFDTPAPVAGGYGGEYGAQSQEYGEARPHHQRKFTGLLAYQKKIKLIYSTAPSQPHQPHRVEHQPEHNSITQHHNVSSGGFTAPNAPAGGFTSGTTSYQQHHHNAPAGGFSTSNAPAGGFTAGGGNHDSEEKYQSDFAAHAQAYG